jgi:hypothetical protein
MVENTIHWKECKHVYIKVYVSLCLCKQGLNWCKVCLHFYTTSASLHVFKKKLPFFITFFLKLRKSEIAEL